MARALLLLVLLCTSFLFTEQALYNVMVGYMSSGNNGTDDMAWSGMGFFPPNITINQGDTVEFDFYDVHTVSFSSVAWVKGALSPFDFLPGSPPQFAYSSWMGPLGGVNVSDMSANYSSGLLVPGANYTAVFPTVGVFFYACALHPYMLGMVMVVNDSSANTTADVTAAGNAMTSAWEDSLSGLEMTNNLYNTTPAKTALTGGASQYTILIGFGSFANVVPSAFNRFIPGNLTINQGDALFFKWNSFEGHDVDFNGTAAVFNDADTPCGTNQLCFNSNYFSMYPPGAAQPYMYNGSGFTGSGVFSPNAPSNNWTVAFTAAGMYPYICSLHDDMGMKGVITVNPGSTSSSTGSTNSTSSGTGSTNSTSSGTGSTNSTSTGSTNSTSSGTGSTNTTQSTSSTSSKSSSSSSTSSSTSNAMSLACSVISLALVFIAFN